MAEKTNYQGDLPRPSEAVYVPTIFVSPEEKVKRPYCLQVAKSVYTRSWSSYQSPYGNFNRNKFIDNKMWANGMFDVQAFMGGKKQQNDRDMNPMLKHLDFDPVTEMPKIQDIVIGYLEQLDYTITATPINPAAGAEKENRRLAELAKVKLAGFAQQVNAEAGQEVMPPQEQGFETEEEVNMFFNMGGYKAVGAMQIRLGNQIVENDSAIADIRKLWYEDAFCTGRFAVDTEVDEKGKLKYKYVDIVNCGVEDFRGHYLEKPSKIWYIEVMTVQQLLLDSQKSQNPLTPEECKQIAMRYENKYDNPSWSAAEGAERQYVNTDTTIGFFWYQFKIPVMKCYWEELDVYKTSTKEKAGKKLSEPTKYSDASKIYYDASKAGRPPVLKEKKVDEFMVHNYYQAKWIPGTDYVYDYGRVPFQSRDPYNISRALCPLKYYRITNQPLAERIKPYAKKIYMAWLKFDNEVARARPAGYKINVKALENISLGQGKTFTVQHGIEMFNETGDLIYADEAQADEYGRTKGKNPIESIEQRAVLDGMRRWIEVINYYKQRIVELTGINEFMDATDPNSNTAATVAKAAIAGSKNSMSQISSGVLSMAEKMALDTSARLQLIVDKYGEYSGYADSIGNGFLEAASVGKEILTYNYGIMVKAKPNEQQKQEMKAAVYQSFANMATPEQGGTWVSDALHFQEMIDNGVDMELVRLMMTTKQKQNLAVVQKMKNESIQLQTQGNKETAQVAVAAEIDKEVKLSEIRKQELTWQTNEAIRLEKAKSEFKTENQIVTNQQKSEQKNNSEVLKSTLGK